MFVETFKVVTLFPTIVLNSLPTVPQPLQILPLNCTFHVIKVEENCS